MTVCVTVFMLINDACFLANNIIYCAQNVRHLVHRYIKSAFFVRHRSCCKNHMQQTKYSYGN